MPSPVFAETFWNTVDPPQSSGIRACEDNWVRTSSGFARGTSILLTATTIGTSAARA